MTRLKHNPTWYQKCLAGIALFSSVFMFVAFSSSYANTMKWIDLQLGRVEMRYSKGMEWVDRAIGAGLDVDAQLSVAVVEDVPKRIEDALTAAANSFIQQALGGVLDKFQEVADKVQDLDQLYAGLGDVSGKINQALLLVTVPESEKELSTIQLVKDSTEGKNVPASVLSDLANAVARYRIGAAALKTDSPINPAGDAPSQESLNESKAEISAALNKTCQSGGGVDSLPFSNLLYTPGCSRNAQTEIDDAVDKTVEKYEQAKVEVEKRAPDDCSNEFMNASNLNLDGGQGGIASDIHDITGQLITVPILEAVQSVAGSMTVETMTVDECNALDSSDINLAGAQVTPPSSSGASGLQGLVDSFISSIETLIDNLANSLVELASNALDGIYASFPRIFDEGLNAFLGNFDSAILDDLDSIITTIAVSEVEIEQEDDILAQMDTKAIDSQKQKQNAL